MGREGSLPHQVLGDPRKGLGGLGWGHKFMDYPWPSCCRPMSWMARLTCAPAPTSLSTPCSATMASRFM